VAIANQCRAGALHVNEDLVVLEPVDERGAPVPPGARSDHVLLTNLVEEAQPVLRYKLEDSVTVLPETAPCPCGSSWARIRVEGRSDDTFFLADAHGRHHPFPPVPFEVLFLREPALERYQLVHARQNALEIHFVGRPGVDRAEVARRLEASFRAYLEASPVAGCVEVRAVPVCEIPREAAGHKLRQIRSEVARPSPERRWVG
jgi:phenylacetate-coenzyme A ligase PaaK-like adenylate-forming protein